MRLGLSGAAGRFGVTPDLATFGKAIGSGYPIAAVAGSADIVDVVTRGAVHSGTFNGNALAAAALQATLDVLSDPVAYRQIDETAATLVDGFRAAAADAGHVMAVHSLGASVFVAAGVESYTGPADYSHVDWRYWNQQLAPAMLARGIFQMPGGKFFLSTEHGPQEARKTVDAFASAISELEPPRRKQ